MRIGDVAASICALVLLAGCGGGSSSGAGGPSPGTAQSGGASGGSSGGSGGGSSGGTSGGTGGGSTPPQPTLVDAKVRTFIIPAVDIVSDPSAGRLYAAYENYDEVGVLSAGDYQVLRRIYVGSRPHRLAFSADRQSIYVALLNGGSVSGLQWRTHPVTRITGAAACRPPHGH